MDERRSDEATERRRKGQAQVEQLRRWFDPFESVLVAYSGGVDSALVMAVAHQQLGRRALACVGISPSYPVREMRQAASLAEQLQVPFRLINTEEHLDANYAANPDNRCYYCKNELYGRLRRLADDEGWQVIADGTNASDLGDDRPGMIAAHQQEVRSPLAELSMTKAHVRDMARALDLPVWDKPAMACLSSRVPHGTPITPELLRQIEAAEDVLVTQGFTQFRVRHHGEVARIELPAADLARAVELRSVIVPAVRDAGYRHVCLDLAGFRSGSLNAEGDPGPAQVPLTVKGDT